jgi:hypothetical protein
VWLFLTTPETPSFCSRGWIRVCGEVANRNRNYGQCFSLPCLRCSFAGWLIVVGDVLFTYYPASHAKKIPVASLIRNWQRCGNMVFSWKYVSGNLGVKESVHRDTETF